MNSDHAGMSHYETVPNTYVIDTGTQKQNDLLGSLSRCYRAHEKEMELSNTLADAIRQFCVDRDDEVLTDALRRYRAHRYPDEA